MKISLLIYFFVAGLTIISAELTRTANETEINSLETVNFGGLESENKSDEAQRKRDSGYTYNKPYRFNRPRLNSGLRGRFTVHPNQLKRPFIQYGLPSTSQEQNINHQQPHNKYLHPNKLPSTNLQNQGVPTSITYVDFSESNPIASQNNEPFQLGTANYSPPKNQKLPDYAVPDAFSAPLQGSISENQNQQMNHQNVFRGSYEDQRISDAALFLSQNAQTLSQLYRAPAPIQEYAPIDEYLNEANQSPNQQNMDKHQHPQTENFHTSQGSQGSQVFPGPLPSYASGILSSLETLQNIQSLEKDRLISQLQQALIDKAHFQNSETLGRNSPTQDASQQTGSEPANPGGPQLVSPSAFGSEQNVYGHTPFLSGSAISPPGFGLGYGLPTSGHGTTVPPSTTPISQPQGPIGASSSQPGAALPAAGGFTPSLSAFPQFGTYIPTLIPGTNLLANFPFYGNGLLNPGTVSAPNNPVSSSPTHFGIPIPSFSVQKPVSGNPTVIVSPDLSGPPGVQISNPGNPLFDPVKPFHPSIIPSNPVGPLVHPVASPAQPVHPVGNPSHSVQPGLSVTNPIYPIANPSHPAFNPIHSIASPVLPIGPARPVATPAYPVVIPVHPTYGVQPSFVKTLFIKPLKTLFPVYYYQNVPVRLLKAGSTNHPWNYAPKFQQTKPTPDWQ